MAGPVGTELMEVDPPSIWHLMGQRASEMVGQALDQAHGSLALGADAVSSLRERLTELLHSPLDHLAAWHKHGIGNISMNEEVDVAVSGAVSQALNDLNITDGTTNSSSFQQELVKILDREIELDMMNKVFSNVSRTMEKREDDFFHNLPFKDETMFVALLCMGIIMPIIFLTLFFIYVYKRRIENIERSQEMLLQNAPEFSMDEYTSEQDEGGNSSKKREEEQVPDLILYSPSTYSA